MGKIELSMRRLVIDKLQTGKSQMQVATELKIGKSTVQYIWNKYKTTGQTNNQTKSGRPLKSTERERRHLVMASKKNPFYSAPRLGNEVQFKNNISIWTVRRILRNAGLFSRMSVKKPFLNRIQIKKRMRWCNDYRNWGFDQWENVIFSDECKI